MAVKSSRATAFGRGYSDVTGGTLDGIGVIRGRGVGNGRGIGMGRWKRRGGGTIT